MNWKVCYIKDIETGNEIKTIEDVEKSGQTQLKIDFPAFVPDNTNCFYYSSFFAYEFDYVAVSGIDTISEIFIDGVKVFTTGNDYQNIELAQGLSEGTHEILVHVHPKFGKFATIRSIDVKRRKKCEMRNVSVKTSEIDESCENAVVAVSADIKIRDDSSRDFSEFNYKLTLRDEKKTYFVSGEINYNHIDTKIQIPRVRLWWPKNYGKQVLYDVDLTVFDGNRILDVYNVKLPICTIDQSVGACVINDKPVCLTGPSVFSIGDPEKLIDKLDSLSANLCVLPKSYEGLTDEDLEIFYEHGIYCSFKNTVPDLTQSVNDIKRAIENYRITKLYQPSWAIPENKDDFAVIHNVNQPLCLIIEKKSSELYAVSDLGYIENVTYIVKDMTDGGKIVSTDIVDIEPGSTKPIAKIPTVPGHNYQISWTTNSGKMHVNTF